MSELREWIANARTATGAREVRLNKIPLWARRSIQRAYRAEGTRAGHLLDVALLGDDRWRHLFDHWGTSHIPSSNGVDTQTFCTEPYAGRWHIETALRFADWIGCDVRIGGASWWYPGSTVRIEFLPRAEATR